MQRQGLVEAFRQTAGRRLVPILQLMLERLEGGEGLVVLRTVVSTATLQAVSDWFPGIDLEESRRRFRTSLEIGGVSAFWEDRLFSVHERDSVRFTVGDVNVEGTNPCPRCTVPARDSLSGNDMIGFQKRFSDLRRSHYPSWACQPDRIDAFYHLATNTRVAPTEHGKVLRVGDSVSLG